MCLASDSPLTSDRDRLRIPSEMHRRLARRVCTPDDVDVFVLAHEGIGDRASVVDTSACQPLDTWDSQPTPFDSHRK